MIFKSAKGWNAVPIACVLSLLRALLSQDRYLKMKKEIGGQIRAKVQENTD